MEMKELIARNFKQMWGTVDRGLDGLTQEELSAQPKPECNSIGWIAWHMARVEDWWVHSVLDDRSQVWQQGWARRMGMPDETRSTGAGMTPEGLSEFKTPTNEELTGYIQAVRKDTDEFIEGITAEQIDRGFETVFGRTMTMGEIFSHLFCEMNQHAGQISYVRGYLRGYQERRV